MPNDQIIWALGVGGFSALGGAFLTKVLVESGITKTPDMDWYEACEEIAHSFSKHAERIHEYLCSYDAVLPSAVRDKIEDAERIATDGTFQFNWNSAKADAEPTDEAITTAEELYNALNEAIMMFQGLIENQLGHRDGGNRGQTTVSAKGLKQ